MPKDTAKLCAESQKELIYHVCLMDVPLMSDFVVNTVFFSADTSSHIFSCINKSLTFEEDCLMPVVLHT